MSSVLANRASMVKDFPGGDFVEEAHRLVEYGVYIVAGA